MSLSYPGSSRSSRYRGYSSLTSNSSIVNSRQLSTNSPSSGASRLGYGTATSSYGSSYTSNRIHTPSSTRTGLFAATPSQSSVSYSRHEHSTSRRPSYTGTLSHVGQEPVKDSGSRKASCQNDVFSDVNYSTSHGLNRVRKDSLRTVSHRDSRIDAGPNDNGQTSGVISRRRSRGENERTSADGDRITGRHGFNEDNKDTFTSAETKKGNDHLHESEVSSRHKREKDEIKDLSREPGMHPNVVTASSYEYGGKGKLQVQKINKLATTSGETDTKSTVNDDLNTKQTLHKSHLQSDRATPLSDSGDFANSRLNQSKSAAEKICGAISDHSKEDSTGFRKLYSTKSFSKPAETAFSNLEHSDLGGTLLEKKSGQEITSGVVECDFEFHDEDNSRKPLANGSAKVGIKSQNNAAYSAAQADIIRLESLCESRTKELTHTKMQLRATGQAFDAMAVLVKYCCTSLNAFECPLLTKKLEVLQKQMAECVSKLANLSAQKEMLENSLAQVTQEKDEAIKRAEEACSTIQKEREEHSQITHEMDDTHNAALTAQRDELTSKHTENVNKLNQFHDRQIEMLRLAHDRQMSDMKNDNKLEMNAMKISHLEEIQELRNKHDCQMEELHKQHRNKLEDITHRFESIKLTLSEKVESLRGECDELARRARSSEEALQRDADAKVQIALAPYLSLPKEIDSLKMVMEMRNEEIQKLRSRNMDFEKQLEEIPIAREKIISLQQKVENLEAIINIKTDHEKQLHEKCQILMRKCDRESRANKRLSMDYEQVMWRMSQSSEFGSCESLTKGHFSRSPPHSKECSPDSRCRAASPNTGHSDVIMRVKKRSSHSISEGDRKLRSRSATFVIEKNESSDSHSPSASPQMKHKRWRVKSHVEEQAAESENRDQVCSSRGSEILMQQQAENRSNIDMLSSAEMGSSYARSLSGVSDSGMYDSLSKSDVLDFSLVSTDSEWGTSVNLSLNCDSTLDLESGPAAGEYHSLNRTVIENNGSEFETNSYNITISCADGSDLSDSSEINHPSEGFRPQAIRPENDYSVLNERVSKSEG